LKFFRNTATNKTPNPAQSPASVLPASSFGGMIHTTLDHRVRQIQPTVPSDFTTGAASMDGRLLFVAKTSGPFRKPYRASGFPARAIPIEKRLDQFRRGSKSGFPQSGDGGRELDQVALGGDEKNCQRTRRNQVPAGRLPPALCFVDIHEVRGAFLGQCDHGRFSRVQPG